MLWNRNRIPGILTSCIWLLLFQSCGEDPYAVEMQAHREQYVADLLAHPQSPLTLEISNMIKYYKPDEKYRVMADFIWTKDEIPFEMPTYSGTTKPYIKYGVLKFKLDGDMQELTVFQQARYPKVPGQEYYLFLPFRDATNGEGTYGGGRYLDLTVDDIVNDRVILDFNLAYNPWCAYADGYRCPIPPPENNLDIPVKAGEQDYKGHKKPATLKPQQ